MSSWIVSRRHIDLLVTAILTHTPDHGPGPGPDGGTRIATDAARSRRTPAEADRIGQVLWAANHAAVNHRYDEHTWTPTYHHTPESAGALPANPSHPRSATPPAAVMEVEGLLFLIKQIDCYDYQCADLPTWEVHPARAWTAALRELLVERFHALVPGVDPTRAHAYQAAPWGIG